MQRSPITDSPLFWLMLFASVGLVMLAAVEPKFATRHERIERMQQSRERAAERTHPAGNENVSEPAIRWQPGRPVTLRPLMLFVVAILVLAMIGMQIRLRKQRHFGPQKPEA